MPHDAHSQAETPVILSDLLALTGAAVAPAQALLDKAKAHLRVKLSENGRISGALIEQNQTAAHGLAWLATYVEALRQMHGWADRLQGAGKFGEVEQLILQISFGEYLWQIYGGIPMSQGEMLRPQDIGLTQESVCFLACELLFIVIWAKNCFRSWPICICSRIRRQAWGWQYHLPRVEDRLTTR